MREVELYGGPLDGARFRMMPVPWFSVSAPAPHVAPLVTPAGKIWVEPGRYVRRVDLTRGGVLAYGWKAE